MLDKIILVAFDVDGCLIETKRLHFECLNEALEKIANITITVKEQSERYDGMTTVEKLKLLNKEKGLSKKLFDDIKKLKQKLTYERLKELKPKQKFKVLFRLIKKHDYKIAICSNAVRKTVDLVVDKLEIGQYIDLILSNEDVTYSKPDPEIYKKAASYFGITPHQCVAIEDGRYGIESAKLAGFHIVEVESPKQVHDKIIKFLNAKAT